MSGATGAGPSRLIEYLELAHRHLETKGVDTARLDAELLLAEALGLTRVELYTNHDRPLAADEVDRFRELLKRRASREPVAYITGRREFWSLDFKVDRRVLIPRPETEVLVEATLDVLRSGVRDGSVDEEGRRVLDVGTGSGAIAVALAVELPGLKIVACDSSESALEIAPENARRHEVAECIEFVHGDAFDGLDAEERFDVIVSNPPYCKEGELDGLEPEVREWEPKGALVSGADGMNVTSRIIEGAAARLRPGGTLLLEVGTQADATRRLLDAGDWSEVRVLRDLAGHDRVLAARRPVQ